MLGNSLALTLGNPVLRAAAASYTQSRVDNQGTAYLRNSAYVSSMADSPLCTFSCWLYPQTATAAAAHRVFQLTLAGGSLFLLNRTSGANTLQLAWGYNAIADAGTPGSQLTTTIVTGNISDGWHHIFLRCDADVVGTEVYVDGTLSYSVAPNFPGFTTQYSLAVQVGICAGHAGGNIGDYQIADVFFRRGYYGAVADFYGGGTPPDISSLGTSAEVFIKGNASVWNTPTNSGVGVGGALTTTGTYIDV